MLCCIESFRSSNSIQASSKKITTTSESTTRTITGHHSRPWWHWQTFKSVLLMAAAIGAYAVTVHIYQKRKQHRKINTLTKSWCVCPIFWGYRTRKRKEKKKKRKKERKKKEKRAVHTSTQVVLRIMLEKYLPDSGLPRQAINPC